MEQKSLRSAITWKPGQNLNKDNFWNFVEECAPYTFHRFSEWIDRYKESEFVLSNGKKINWDGLFGNNTPTVDKIKFHDVPFEMQLGVITHFLMLVGAEQFVLPLGFDWMRDFVEAICERFEMCEP